MTLEPLHGYRYTTHMEMIYLILGSALSGIAFLFWIAIIGAMFFEFASAYVDARLPVRPKLVRIVWPKPIRGYSSDRNKYQNAGLNWEDALKGEHAFGIVFIGALFILASLLIWPVVLGYLILRYLREYKNNEAFRDWIDQLFRSDPKPRKVKQKKEFELKL